MSVSGMFLKKVIFINPHKTLREIINIMDLLGFSYTVDPVTSESQGFQLGIHDPTCNSDFACTFSTNLKLNIWQMMIFRGYHLTSMYPS